MKRRNRRPERSMGFDPGYYGISRSFLPVRIHATEAAVHSGFSTFRLFRRFSAKDVAASLHHQINLK
jgi:hypothetical protein